MTLAPAVTKVEVTTGQVPLVTLAGELDQHSAPELREGLHRLIADGQHEIDVHMGAVTFLDSTILGVLVRAHRTLRREGGGLLLLSVPRGVHRVLRLTGLADFFDLQEDTRNQTVGGQT